MPTGKAVKKNREQIEIFTGRGNNEKEAKQSAMLRYQSWQLIQRRAGYLVNVISEVFNIKENNEINFKCELIITFSKQRSAGKQDKKSFFNLISNIVRTIKP